MKWTVYMVFCNPSIPPFYMANFNILGWNVQGLNSPIKCTCCLELLHFKMYLHSYDSRDAFHGKQWTAFIKKLKLSTTKSKLIQAPPLKQLEVMENSYDNDMHC